MSHADEVLALLTATGFTIHDSSVPSKPSYPYAVARFPTPMRSINSLSHTSNRLDMTFSVISVATKGDSLRKITPAIQAALLDVTVTVAGWVNYPIRDVPNDQPMREDLEITLTNGRHPLYVPDEYHLAAEKV